MTAETRDRAEDEPRRTVVHGAFVNRVFRNRFDVPDSPRYEVMEPTESSARAVSWCALAVAMKLAHFVITQFGLRGKGQQLFPDIDGPTWDLGAPDPLKPRIVNLRLRLLEMTCLPGLLSQTNQNFTWVLLVDSELKAGFKERLRKMARAKDRVVLHEHRPDAPDRLEALGWLVRLLPDRPDYVLTTINDDDDALPRRFVDVVQSHVFGLSARGRLPPFKLMGATRGRQWDLIFTPDAPLGWAASRSELPSVASCGFSLLCRYPAFDFSVRGMEHHLAKHYFDPHAPPRRENVRFYRQAFLEAARDARVGRIPVGEAAFFDTSPPAGAVVMTNHGGNDGMHPSRSLRPSYWRGRSGRSLQAENASHRPVLGAETFPDVEIDWTAVRRHAGHFSPRRVAARLSERKLSKRIRRFKRRVRAEFPRSRPP